MAAPDWQHFPSVNALKAFEAVARMQGFAPAARLLNVTPAAVAQQVRGLEQHLGAGLVYRSGRALALTPEGTALAQGLTEGFGIIETALADLRRAQGIGPLRITMTPGFATSWLMPRLGAFWAEHPGIDLSLHPDRALTDLRREGMDLGIRHGRGHWPGLEAQFLLASADHIVGAPALLAGLHDPGLADLAALPWVLPLNFPEDLAVLQGLGLDVAKLKISYFASNELCLAATLQGYGLSIMTNTTVEHEVVTGRLIALRNLPVSTLAYYMVTPTGPTRPEVKRLVQWLKSQIRINKIR